MEKEITTAISVANIAQHLNTRHKTTHNTNITKTITTPICTVSSFK
ncbi:MAG: hypothetical protein WCX88_00160 [Patescibacteria group bacterium]